MKPGDRVVFTGWDGPLGERGTVDKRVDGFIDVIFDEELTVCGITRRDWNCWRDSIQTINEGEEMADARRDLVTAIARRGSKAGGA